VPHGYPLRVAVANNNQDNSNQNQPQIQVARFRRPSNTDERVEELAAKLKSRRLRNPKVLGCGGNGVTVRFDSIATSGPRRLVAKFNFNPGAAAALQAEANKTRVS